MQVTYHIGLHSTDEDRAISCLLSNAETLGAVGVAVPATHRARTVAREAMLSGRGTPATAAAQENFLSAVGLPQAPRRLVLSSDSFLCVPRRALENDMLYPTAAERAHWMRALFPDSDTRICLALRNPLTWLPAVHARFGSETTFGDWLGATSIDSLSWIDLVARLKDAVPDADIVLWCHEDAALIWPEILTAMISPEGIDHRLAGEDQFLCALLHPEAADQLAGYLRGSPGPVARREACRAFLERFAQPDLVSAEPTALADHPAWTTDLAARVTERYERDVAALRATQEVTVLAA